MNPSARASGIQQTPGPRMNGCPAFTAPGLSACPRRRPTTNPILLALRRFPSGGGCTSSLAFSLSPQDANCEFNSAPRHPALEWHRPARFTFESTGAAVWGGQFTGCAQLSLSPPKGSSHKPKGQNWLRNDPGPSNWTKPASVPPVWAKDLVMYELNPRGFSSPGGAGGAGGAGGNGAGTFAGLTARVPYLKALGITAVWL